METDYIKDCSSAKAGKPILLMQGRHIRKTRDEMKDCGCGTFCRELK